MRTTKSNASLCFLVFSNVFNHHMNIYASWWGSEYIEETLRHLLHLRTVHIFFLSHSCSLISWGLNAKIKEIICAQRHPLVLKGLSWIQQHMVSSLRMKSSHGQEGKVRERDHDPSVFVTPPAARLSVLCFACVCV